MTPHIYIIYSGDASDEALATSIAENLAALPAEIVLITAAELVHRQQDLTRIPEVHAYLRDDPRVPFRVRFLPTCCPQMTISQAADARQLRYIVEHTRRQGKWNHWLTTLSARSMAAHRILKMPGIAG